MSKKSWGLSEIFASIGSFLFLAILTPLLLVKASVPLWLLISAYFGSIFLSEALFNKYRAQNRSLYSWIKLIIKPRAQNYVLFAYASEVLFDMIFLYLSLMFQWNPLHFFILLLGCKSLSSPVAVIFSRNYLSKNASYMLSVPTQILCLYIGSKSPTLFSCALIFKCLICNGIAVSRDQFAEEISLKNLRRPHS